MVNKVGLICTRGLPARYGAYEQCVASIVEHVENETLFYVPTTPDVFEMQYFRNNVIRLKIPRFQGGAGTLLYGMLSWLLCYLRGVRTFIFFGYGLSPFFLLFRILGCRVICNTDGIEWRRAKWSGFSALFLKFCEFCAARSGVQLVFDAHGIQRYFSIIHRVSGELIFYGSEPAPLANLSLPSKKILSDIGFIPQEYFVVVMRMEPENNIKTIIQAFSEFGRARFPLLLIGPATNFFINECLPLVDQCRINSIKYLGPIYDRQILSEIRSASFAYIHGHSVGGTNPTLVEACSLSNRILAFNSMFNREVLKQNGRYFSSAESLFTLASAREDFPRASPLDPRYTWPYVSNRYRLLIEKRDK